MSAILIDKVLTTHGVIKLANTNGALINTINIDEYGRKQTPEEVMQIMINIGMVFPANALDLVQFANTVNIKLMTFPNGNYFWIAPDRKLKAYYADNTDSNLINFDMASIATDFVHAYFVIQYAPNTGKYYIGNAPYCSIYKAGNLYTGFCPISTNTHDITTFIGEGVNVPNDPYGTMPDNDNPGSGYGPYDYTSETDLPPALPSASAAQCGFVSLWNPTITELQGLASYLWTSGLFDINTWRHLFSNPMDCILSVGIIPFVPDRSNSKEEIVFCGTSHSAISSYRVPTQMYILPMGTMHITGMSGGYTDYEPYAKASLFLPYCGTYALSCDEIVDADLSLEYHVDIYTGACVAYLTITRTNSNGEQVNAVMYQFTGNMLSTIPVTGADHSNFIQSLLFMGAAIGATVATSGAAAPEIGGAMAAGDAVAGSTALTAATAGSAINTVMSMKPNVMRSGNLSSNAGLLGKQAPTITMTWSNICRPEDEYKLAGMPLHKSGTLSDFSGFTVVSAVHMDNILCTEEEKAMIEELLYKGVII